MAEEAAAPLDIGAVQSFWATVDQRFSDSDSLLRNFKRPELDATIAAASTGKYAEYWTVDKLAELNNTVDANQACHPDLKALFAASSTKNPRLKANRVGQLVFQYVGKLKDGGVSSAPVSAPPALSSSGGGGGGGSLGGGAGGGAGGAPVEYYGRLQKFAFSPHLPVDCQLRVRAAPSTDAEPLGYVTQADEIYADRRMGDWIAVRLADVNQEAWMLMCTPDQQLLVPVPDPSPALSSSAPPPPASFLPPPSNPVPSNTLSFHQPTPVLPPSMVQYAAMPFQGAANPLAASQSFAPESFRPSSAVGRGMPDAVPYAAYQALEQRVSMLEHTIQQMRAVLRSL